MSPSRSLALFAFAAFFPVMALAQGRPDFIWLRGGQSGPLTLYDNGNRAITGFGNLQFWDTSDGSFLRSVNLPYTYVYNHVITPQGDLIAASVRRNADPNTPLISYIRESDGVELHSVLLTPQTAAGWMAFSPDGQTLATTGLSPRFAYLWRVSDGELLHTLDVGELMWPRGLAYSPDGEFVAVSAGANAGDYTDSLTVFRTSDGSRAWRRCCWDPGYGALAFSPDGQYLAALDPERSNARLYLTSDGSLHRTLQWSGSCAERLTFRPDGASLLVSDDHRIHEWQISDGQLIRTLAIAELSGVEVSPDGTRLYVATRSGGLRALNYDDGEFLMQVVESLPIERCAFAPDDRTIVTSISYSAPAGAIQLRGAIDGALIWERVDYHYSSLDISPDGRLVAFAAYPDVSMLRAEDGAFVRAYPSSGIAHSIDFSPDGGRFAATGGSSGQIWNVDGNVPTARFGTGVEIVAYSPDGTLIAASTFFRGIELWDSDGASLVRTLGDDFDGGFTAFSPDGDRLAVWHWDSALAEGQIRIWNVNDASVMQIIRNVDFPPYHPIAFLRDGRIVSSAGDDRGTDVPDPTIRFWSVETGRELRRYDAELGVDVRWLVFSSDERYFAIGRSEGMLALARNPCHPSYGDLDADCQTGLSDLAVLLASFGTCAGDPDYNPLADIAESGCIDAADLAALLANFGK